MNYNPAFEASGWNAQIAALPQPHVLQTWEWGQVKALVGWEPFHRFWWGDEHKVQAAAMILKRTWVVGKITTPLKVMYIPRGPLMDWSDPALRKRVLDEIQVLARRQGAIFIKMDPEVILGKGVPGREDEWESPLGLEVTDDLKARGWQFSGEQIQFRNTIWVDLSHSEEELLASMKQKMRYNIRLAERKGVSVRPGRQADLPMLYKMYAETSIRDGFVIRDESYYRQVWERFIRAGLAEPLIAEVDGEAISAVILFRYAGRAWYMYGMSTPAHREKMPNALLQWEAMRRSKAVGCKTYDLWGAPDVFDDRDSMWGVFRFKEGLGGQVIRTLGAWDYPVNPSLYRLYTRTLPQLLSVMRRRGRARTRKEVSA